MTLTLAKELCGFDLRPNGGVLTRLAAGGSTAEAGPCLSLSDSVGNLRPRGRPGSFRDHLVFFCPTQFFPLAH